MIDITTIWDKTQSRTFPISVHIFVRSKNWRVIDSLVIVSSTLNREGTAGGRRNRIGQTNALERIWLRILCPSRILSANNSPGSAYRRATIFSATSVYLFSSSAYHAMNNGPISRRTQYFGTGDDEIQMGSRAEIAENARKRSLYWDIEVSRIFAGTSGAQFQWEYEFHSFLLTRCKYNTELN